MSSPLSSVLYVEPAHPALPGHFPGTPVVPGVVLLTQVITELSRQKPGLTVCGIIKLKFLRMLLPGQLFSVEFGEVENAALRFRCLQDQSLLAEGRLAIRAQA